MPKHNAQQRLDALPVIPGVDSGDVGGVQPVRPTGKGPSIPTVPASHIAAAKEVLPDHSVPIAGGVKVTSDELRLLCAVSGNPGRKAGDYPKLARMGAKKCSDTRLALVRRGLLAQEPIQLKGRGRNALVITVTDAGRKALEDAS